jgi:hypothetical protein
MLASAKYLSFSLLAIFCNKNNITLTLRVFSNWLLMRVIMPSAAMKDRRDSTCTQQAARMAAKTRPLSTLHCVSLPNVWS